MDKTPPVYVFKIQTPKRSTTLRLAGPFFVLGRGEPYRIFHEDPTLSREHLAVVTTEGGYLVKDLGSRNGVFLNGERLPRYAEKPLSLGDVLTAGNTKVQLVLQQEVEGKDSVTVAADGSSTALEAPPPADVESEDEEFEGEVTGELDRPELLDDEDGDDADPEETQIAMDDDEELLGELPSSVDGLVDEIDAVNEERASRAESDTPSELALDAVATDLGVTAEELEADLDTDDLLEE